MNEHEAPPPRDPDELSVSERAASGEPEDAAFRLITPASAAAVPPLPPIAPAASVESMPQPPPVPPPLVPPQQPSPQTPPPPPSPAAPAAPPAPEPPTAPPPPPTSGASADAPPPTPDSRGSGWAMAAHLTSLFGFGFSCLLVGAVGPLIVWLAKKDSDPEADWHGRESLNFQLNVLILWVIAIPLYLACCTGLLLHIALPFYQVVMVILASIQAAEGKRWRYPFTLRLLND